MKQITAEPKDARVVIHLDNEAEEASFAYDLVASGRLQTEQKDTLPLPFRGKFLFKLPERSHPVEIQVGRFEPTPTEILAGDRGLRIVVACPHANSELISELETALRELPPASDEELKEESRDRMDEFNRVRQMTFAQKVIYATRAGQTGRSILVQQPTPLLVLYLIKNPLITLIEIIAIAKMPSIDALVAEALVRMLRSNPQWGMNEELKLALAMNTKTPPGTAIALLRYISSKNLRKLAKCEVGTSVKNAALKILLDRRD